METTEEQMPASRPPGEGRAFRLFDGTTCALEAPGSYERFVEEDGASRVRPEGPLGMEEVLESARRDGIELLITPV